MKVLVTGAHGKVGRTLVPAFMRAGHDVRTTDLARPDFDRILDPSLVGDYFTAASISFPLMASFPPPEFRFHGGGSRLRRRPHRSSANETLPVTTTLQRRTNCWRL